MTSIMFLIGQERIAIGIYILIGAGIVFFMRQFSLQGTEYRATYFELERELARYRQMNALTAMVLLVQVALIVLGIQQAVIPVLEQQVALGDLSPVVEDLPFNTPTPAPAAAVNIQPQDIGEDDLEGIVQITPTLTPTPVGTIIPSENQVGCDSDQAYLQIPANGMRVFQAVPVRGTVFTEDFAYAKIELRGKGTFGNFAVIEDIRSPVTNLSEFSQFIPSPYEEGWYEFRLMVFDVTDTLRASCLVNIYISEPFATPTPIPLDG